MATILVLEDHELKMLIKALKDYRTNEYSNNPYDRNIKSDNLMTKLTEKKNHKRKDGQEL